MTSVTALKFGARKAAVADLHQALDLLGVAAEIPESERTARRYGASTRAAIALCKSRYGWRGVDSEHLDEDCASWINTLVAQQGTDAAADVVGVALRWTPFIVPDSAAGGGSRIAALSRRPDTIETWSCGPDDHPQGTSWYADGNGWRRPYPVPGPVSSSTGGLAAVSRKDKTMETFWIGPFGSVHGADWYDEGDRKWHEFRDPIAVVGRAHPTSGLAALSRRSDHQEIWWVGLDGSIQAAYWYESRPSWQPYQIDGTGFDTAARASGVAVVSRRTDAMSAFWIKPNGEVEGAYWRDSGDHKWKLYTRKVAADPDSAARAQCIAAVARTSETIDVVWITPDGAVRGANWTDGAGADWRPYTVAGPGSAVVDSGVAVISRTADSMDAFWVAPGDYSVRGARWQQGVGWQGYTEAIDGPGSVSRGSGLAATVRNKAEVNKSEVVLAWVGPDLSVRGATSGPSASTPEWVVHGMVREDGQPPSGEHERTVKAFDARHVDGEALGSFTTGPDGIYRITYRPPAGVAAARGVAGEFALVVAAFDAEQKVAQSAPKVRPAPIEEIDLDVVSGGWVVRGVVEDMFGQPISGITVVVADRDLGLNTASLPVDEMGRDVSGSHGTIGGFAITYQPTRAGEGVRDGRWTPDLVFRLHGAAGQVSADVYRYTDGLRSVDPLTDEELLLGIEASPDEQVALRLTVAAPGLGGIEFDALTAAVAPLLPAGANAGMLDEERYLDVTFTARETGIDADLVTLFVGAHRMANHDFHDVTPDILYGLARCDQHLFTIAALALATPAQLIDGIKQAIANKIIAPRTEDAIRTAADTVHAQASGLVLDGADGTTPYKGVLDVALGTGADARNLQKLFLQAAAGNEATPQAMWTALRNSPEFRDKVDQTQFALQLDTLTGRSTKLMAAIVAHGVSTAKELLTLSSADFAKLIADSGEAVPADLPGDSDQEKAGYWAAGLAANVHQAFPTLSVAGSVSKAPRLPDVEIADDPARGPHVIDGADIRPALARVLERAADIADDTTHPVTEADAVRVAAATTATPFDIGASRLNTFVAKHHDALFKDIPDDPPGFHDHVTSELNRTQRLYRVSTSPAAMDWLLTKSYRSAFEIALQPQEAFVGAATTRSLEGAPAVGDAEALMMHNRARTIANTVMATHLHLSDARYAMGIRALTQGGPNEILLDVQAADVANPPAGGGVGDIDAITARYLPSWVSMFGTTNYCACTDCQSIYSPAAYLVTLLDFLDRAPANSQGKKPLDILLTHRPDLETLKLTCENTNTAIPYVDLVNRVLESLSKSLNPQDIPAYDIAGATAGELAAAPQNTDWYAYITETVGPKRPDRAAYPHSLPFDAALHATRGYLAHLGVRRLTLLKTFAAQARMHALIVEYLELAPAGFALITGTTLDGDPAAAIGLDERYGFDVEPPDALEQGSATQPVRGRPVWALKQKLIAAGAVLPADADPAGATYDGAVTAAVTTYQGAHGLTVSGKVDAATWHALTPGDPRLPHLLLPHVPTFLHRTSLSYADLVELLTCLFINPKRSVYDIAVHLGLPAKPLIDWITNQLQGPIPAPVQAALDKAKITAADFTAWAVRVIGQNGAPELRRTIVIDNPNPAACDLETSVLRYWDGAQTDISDMDWQRLDQIIRLWRATGWSLDDLDLALVALQPAPYGDVDVDVVGGIARITELGTALDLSVPEVVLLFSDLDPARSTSLYHTVFRNRASQHTDPVFDPDWAGTVLTGATIGKQLPALQSGLRTSDADMTGLRKALGLTLDTAPLTLAGVSAMLRYVTLARALGLNVRDLLTLLVIVTATDQMDTTAPDATGWKLRDFITDVQNLSRTDLDAAQLNTIVAAVTTLDANTIRDQLLTDLSAKLKAIDDDLKPATPLDDDLNHKSEPRQTLARRVLATLQQPDNLVDATMLILSGRDQSTTTITPKLGTAPAIPDTWATRLRYQPQDPDGTGTGSAVITCIGALTDGEATLAKTFSGDARWAAAIDTLRNTPRATLTTLKTNLAAVGVAAAPTPGALLAIELRDDPMHPEYRDADIAVRLQILLDATVPVVRDQARRAMINQTLLAVVPDAVTLDTLLTGVRSTNVPVLPASAPTKPLIDDLLTLGAGAITVAAQQAYELLSRTQQLIDGVALTPSDVDVLIKHVITLRANAVRLLTFTDIRTVEAYARCRSLLVGTADRLPEVIAAADENAARGLLAELLAVPDATITDVVAALKGALLRNPADLERVLTAVKVVTSLGVSVSAATSWIGKPVTPPTVIQVAAQVDEIRRAVKARYDETAWLEVAKALHDPQRDARRGALVDYLVARLDWLAIRNPDGLYQRLFVQVEMSSCMQTSPIRFAIDTVHTFIQRCLLGLEKPVVDPGQIDKQRWDQVLGNQQLWRADLEVLVNPENYILPELRDDKSPAFVELEGALLSDDLTDDAAEAAITGYLEKADAVAKLDIVALHVQRGFDPFEHLQVVVHVLGRTANPPYKHYYRRFVVTDSHTEGWTAWEEVPLDIRGDLITMVTFERRLFLFWAQMSVHTRSRAMRLGKVKASSGQPVQKSAATKSSFSDKPEDNAYEVQVQLCWSEYRTGAWSPKNITEQALSNRYEPQSQNPTAEPVGVLARLETKIDGDRLEVLCIANRQIFPDGARIRVFGSFILDGCHGQLRMDPTPTVARLVLSYRQAIYSGAVFLTDGNILKIKTLNYAREVPASTVLRSKIPNLRLAEEHWIHQGADYVAFSDAERVYFANLQQFGAAINLSLVFAETNYPLTRALARGVTLTDTTSTLALAKKTADIKIQPWVGYNAGISLFAKQAQAIPATPAVAVAEAKTVTRPASQLLTTDINLARAAAYDVGLKFVFPQYTTATISIETLYDPFVCTYLKRLRQYGIPGLLTLENQQLSNQQLGRPGFASKYDPNTPTIVKSPLPTDKVDFGFTTPGVYRANAYAVTNRELFIEIPMLLAKRFRDNRRFEDSLRYLKYVWDFTQSNGDYWRAEPLRLTPAESVEKWLTRLKDGDPDLINQIHEWQRHPFQPHFVARMRPSAYQRYVVMETLDTLLEWADAEFRRDTMESITHATQLYVLVADLCGPRPEAIDTGDKDPQSFKDMRGQITEGLAIVSAEFENRFPSMSSSTVATTADTVGLLGVSRSLYFCIPPNQKLLAYWDTIADRLYKIRHCMNIEGVVRQLPLFEPRIDPALLVRAAAQGLDVSAVIAEAGAPLPPYRFDVTWRRALDVCGVVTRLGSQLLGLIERGDTEALAALNATQATAALKATLDVKKQQEAAADAQIAALQTSRDVPAQRLMYYQFLMGADPKVPQPGENIDMVSYAPKPQSSEGAWLIQEEIDELAASHSARDWQVRSNATQITANLMHYVPNFSIHVEPWGVGTELTFGGRDLGPALSAIAQYQGGLASQDSYVSSHAARMAAHKRRGQDFAIGANTAAREIMNIDKQITVAMINKDVARLEREQVELQITHAQAVENFLADKFTNVKSYGLMQSRLYGVYAQFYKLAYDLAKQAERCYHFRYPELTDSIIAAGNWESGRKGLLAGEQLELQLRQLERAYADRDSREFELTKHVSLRQHAPMALIKLRETGSAEFDLPEMLFDADQPGHFMRRIKSVNLTIPAVVGPYATVNATLTLLSNQIRIKPTLKNQRYERDLDNADDRFVDNFAAVQQIATSSGQNDHGLFELNFRDERFLPFEGAGAANSRWRIDIDPDCNPFDIPDVVMCLKFVARQGGEVLRQKAKDAWMKILKDQEGLPLSRVFSMRHEFPTEWDRLRTVAEANGDHTVAITLTRDRFPALFRRSDLTVGALDVFGVPAEDATPTEVPSLRTPAQAAGETVALANGAPVSNLLHRVARLDDKKVAVHTDPDKAKWVLTASSAPQKASLPMLYDILLLCHYSAKKA